MKLSKKFIQDYTDVSDTNTSELAESMVRIGNEYDSINYLVDTTKLTIGQIVEASKHPESDHLNVCKVDIGSEVLNIICGAPNVRKGMKVIVATDGTKLPGGTIKKTTILGRESNGMLCALNEIGIENKYLKKEDLEGIHELPEDAPIGEDAVKYMNLDDEIIDFELTANRADELSMIGLAYEVAAITGTEVTEPKFDYKSNNESISDTLELKVDTDNVYAVVAKRVNNIKIEESPSFIKNRLMAGGIRPRNKVVDISNYVMLETGQPLHFYDADKLGKCIGIRMANEGEELQTLDDKIRILTNEDIIIVNDKDEAIGLAGVMGGYSTEIDENTKNVVIESAIFKPFNIRY